jgi:hypothetical protein
MKAIVFTGPTIPVNDVSAIVDAVCRPPVSHGDVYRASLERPRAIGIIDGYFEQQPAVWHKEILWAIHEGIQVFGSASMGALRAAELAPFGMVGVGAIYEAYRDGLLEDDDEVALVHGLEETGYRAGSDALVNIRATLESARAAEVLDEESATALVRIAKNLPYAERTYATVIECALDEGLAESTLERWRRWLPAGAVDQKRADAIAMLHAMRTCLEDGSAPSPVNFVFEDALWWNELRRHAAETGQARDDARVLEALSLDRPLRARVVAAALGWQFAVEEARREGATIEAARLVERASELCGRLELPDVPALERWLADNRTTRAGLEQLLESSAVAERASTLRGDILIPTLLQYLRWSGDYVRLLGGSDSLTPPRG